MKTRGCGGGSHASKRIRITAFAGIAAMLITVPLQATEGQDQQVELAKKLANPVASLISVPIQSNWDFGIGPDSAMQYTVNIQPVIPFSISKDWNLITRTIMPVIHAESPVRGGNDRTGLGDILQSFFFSPKEPTGSGWIWGVGPVLLYPSGTDGLSADKWGAGPTAVVLKQRNGWTYGLLAYHAWSYAGSGPASISSTFLEPFLSYTTKTRTTYGVNTESTYDWHGDQWTVPVNLMVAQMLNVDGMPLQLQLGGRIYADKPDGGPDWGIRFAVTFLFPK